MLFILFLLPICFYSFAQSDSNKALPADTEAVIKPAAILKPLKKRIRTDTLKRRALLDTLQASDSTAKHDSSAISVTDISKQIGADTARILTKAVIAKKPIDSFYLKILDNPFFRTKAKPIFLVINERKRTSKDEMFYLLLGLLLFLAFIKLIFSRYFSNIFRLFFQPSFRQKQTREQLQQNNLPSLLLNLFFIFSCGAYVSFLLTYYHVTHLGFWLLLLYSSLSLLILYAGKYLFLTFAGWVFNVNEAANAYIFAVYLVNKILGVILIPFTLIIAFSSSGIINISITISILLILLLFFYRYFVSYSPVRKEVRVSLLHFFFYVFAFEIMPLLLIYKTLTLYLDKSL